MNSVTVTVGSQAITIEFGFPTLEAIETRLGKSLQEVAEEIQAFIPKVEPGAEGPTPEALEAAAKNFRIGFSGRFISACTGIPFDAVPVEGSQPVFQQLVGGFIRALNTLNAPGGADEKKEASPSSVPGPASTAASDGGSSTASAPTNSGG